MCEQGGHSPPREGWVKTPDGRIGATAVTPPHHSPAPLAPPFSPWENGNPSLVPESGGSERAVPCPGTRGSSEEAETQPSATDLPQAESRFLLHVPVAPHRTPPRHSVLQHVIPCQGRDAANTSQGAGTQERSRLLCVWQGSLHRLRSFTTVSCKLLN